MSEETKEIAKKKEMKMTEMEIEANRKIIQRMNKKLNFRRNPRFKVIIPPKFFSEIEFNFENRSASNFVAKPEVVNFKDFHVGEIYKVTVTLTNRTQLLSSFQLVPPFTEAFSISKVSYPKKESNLIAPGMAARVDVLFKPSNLNNAEDEICVKTERANFVIPLRAIRDLPALSLENPINCNTCLVGDIRSTEIKCRNNGGDASFKFFLRDELVNMAEKYKSTENFVSKSNFSEFSHDAEVLQAGPFTIYPKEFFLAKNQASTFLVNFTPEKEGLNVEDVVISCDGKTFLDFTVEGTGNMIDLKILQIDEINVASSEEKLKTLFFEDTYPYSSLERKIIVLNNSNSPVKYHWHVVNTKDYETLFEEAQEYFEITPREGMFNEHEQITFSIKFSPEQAIDYSYQVDLFIEDIPYDAIRGLDKSVKKKRVLFGEKQEPYVLGFNSPYPSFPIFSFDLRGKGKPSKLEVNAWSLSLGYKEVNQYFEGSFEVSNNSTEKTIFCFSSAKENYNNPKIKPKVNNFFDQLGNNKSLHRALKFKKLNTLAANLLANGEKDFDIINEDEDVSQIEITSKDYIELKVPKDYLLSYADSPKKTVMGHKATKSDELFFRLLKKSEKAEFLDKMSENEKRAKEEFDLKRASEDRRVEVSRQQKIVIKKGQTIKFDVKIKAQYLGKYHSKLDFKVEEGEGFAVEFTGDVVPKKVVSLTPEVIFGLTPISSIKQRKLTLKNASLSSVKILVKEYRYTKITFDNFMDDDFLESTEGQFKQQDLIARTPVNDIIDYENYERNYNTDVDKQNSHRIKFSTVYAEIPAGDTLDIDVFY